MPAKPLPEPRPAVETRAWLMYQQLEWTPENRRRIAQAFLEDEGDIPAEVVYGFGTMAKDDSDSLAVDELIDSMRAQHFAAMGKPVPEYRSKFR